MIVSIGILAWNEEKTIIRTLTSLFHQSIFSSDPNELAVSKWEIIVVPNGCTDNTAETAINSLNQFCKKLYRQDKVQWKVIEIEQAGKSNAWNHYVHDYSDKDAEVLNRKLLNAIRTRDPRKFKRSLKRTDEDK